MDLAPTQVADPTAMKVRQKTIISMELCACVYYIYIYINVYYILCYITYSVHTVLICLEFKFMRLIRISTVIPRYRQSLAQYNAICFHCLEVH